MRRAPRACVCLGVALVVLAGACSDDPDVVEGSDLHMVIVSSLEQQSADNALLFTTEEADCIATRVTRAIDDDRLRELGVVDRFGLSELDFTPEEEDIVLAALQACADLPGQVAATLAEDSGLSDAQALCVAERYVAGPEFHDAIFSEAFDPALNERIDGALAAALTACATAV